MSLSCQVAALLSPLSSLTAEPKELALQLHRYELLGPLLRNQILEQTLSDVVLTPQESQQLMQRFCKQKGIKDEQALQKFLQREAISSEDLSWRLSLPIRIERYSSEKFGGKAEQHFLERKEQLDSVMYSLLRVKDAYLAQELYLRIAEGEASFAELASDFSEGAEKTNGGSVGPVPLRQAHPELSEALRTHAPGRLIRPFKIEDWWLVVRLNRYIPASFDETTRKRMCAELFQNWLDEQIKDQLQKLSSILAS